MPTLALDPIGGLSSTGHLDPGLFMSTSLTMAPGLAMRGQGAFGDIDLMAPFYLPVMGGVSVTSILVSTAFTRVVPDPFAAQSQTSPLVFAAPLIPDLTASTSSTSILIVSQDILSISSSSLGQMAALITAQTQIALDPSLSRGQMIYPLPFSAGPVQGLSPSGSLSSTSAAFTAITDILTDPVGALSSTSAIPIIVQAKVSGSSASASTTGILVAAPVPFFPDSSFSLSDTEYAIPFVVLNLTSSGQSFTDLWLLAPARVSVRKVRGAGARRLELVGSVPLGG